MLHDFMGNSPTQDGQISKCGCCGSEVFAKTGDEVTWHWSHYPTDACDSWAEPDGESRWHYEWKKYLREQWGAGTEVKIENHRADAVMPDGLVIELQSSKLDPKQIQEREAFYGNMIWIYRAHWFDHHRIFFSEQRPDVLRLFKAAERNWKPSISAKPSFKYPFRWKWADTSQYHIRKPLFWHTSSGQLLEVQLLSMTLFNKHLNRDNLERFGRIMSHDNPFGNELGQWVAA